MKRKLIVMLLAAIMCVNGNISVYAGEINNDNGTLIQDNSVPTYMLPNTVIEYVGDDEYKIIQGGEANENYENGSIYEWARQADHKLKKGDVATRGHVDNPKTGTYITCEAPVKGTEKRLKVTMQKWDIGCLPDAVLDIWKTGVENWGYTWSSSVSINDGYYEYSR